MIPATGVACRTDRRPLAGAVYDPATNTTFITWAGKHADSYAQAYDHAGDTWTDPVWIAGGGDDPHNYPTVVLTDAGEPLVFRGMHNIDLLVSRPAKPHSIEGPWITSPVPGARGATYPMPVKLAGGDIIVFFRETTKTVRAGAPDDTRPIRYVISHDHGATWVHCGHPYVLGSTDRADNMNEVYIGQIRHRQERLELVWTLAGGGPEGNKHDRYHRNIYVASYDPATRHFVAPAGTDLGEVIDNATMERHCRIAETPVERLAARPSPEYIQLVDTLADGRHLALWTTVDATGLPHTNAAVWTGKQWKTAIVATGRQIMEMEPVDASTWLVYTTLDGQPGVDTFTIDAGLRWRPAGHLDTPKPVQRIELVTNGRTPARLLATGASTARPVTTADGDIYLLP